MVGVDARFPGAGHGSDVGAGRGAGGVALGTGIRHQFRARCRRRPGDGDRGGRAGRGVRWLAFPGVGTDRRNDGGARADRGRTRCVRGVDRRVDGRNHAGRAGVCRRRPSGAVHARPGDRRIHRRDRGSDCPATISGRAGGVRSRRREGLAVGVRRGVPIRRRAALDRARDSARGGRGDPGRRTFPAEAAVRTRHRGAGDGGRERCRARSGASRRDSGRATRAVAVVSPPRRSDYSAVARPRRRRAGRPRIPAVGHRRRRDGGRYPQRPRPRIVGAGIGQYRGADVRWCRRRPARSPEPR